MKHWYDQNAKERSLNSENEVLIHDRCHVLLNRQGALGLILFRGDNCPQLLYYYPIASTDYAKLTCWSPVLVARQLYLYRAGILSYCLQLSQWCCPVLKGPQAGMAGVVTRRTGLPYLLSSAKSGNTVGDVEPKSPFPSSEKLCSALLFACLVLVLSHWEVQPRPKELLQSTNFMSLNRDAVRASVVTSKEMSQYRAQRAKAPIQSWSSSKDKPNASGRSVPDIMFGVTHK